MLNAGPWLFGRARGARHEIAEDCLEIAQILQIRGQRSGQDQDVVKI